MACTRCNLQLNWAPHAAVLKCISSRNWPKWKGPKWMRLWMWMRMLLHIHLWRGHKNHHNKFVFVAYAGKAPTPFPSPHLCPFPLPSLFAEACAVPFMKPFRGHISCAVLISLLVIIIVVVIKNENNKIIKPHRRRPTDSGTELEIGQVERSGNRQSTALSVSVSVLMMLCKKRNY